uniref:Uncharacterized protein n=1 Tax=Arundo donax TaxID=35708 RepID=A0A0A8Y6R0_ARUDO
MFRQKELELSTLFLRNNIVFYTLKCNLTVRSNIEKGV